MIIILIISLPNNLVFASSRSSIKWDEVRFEQLEAGKTYEISSGSGFFISSNIIVTNKHVVNSCKNIAGRGAMEPTKLKLLDYDEENDLALLESPEHVSTFVKFPPEQNLQLFEQIYTVGYPQEKSKIGIFDIDSSFILKFIKHSTQLPPNEIKNNHGHIKQIEFSGQMLHGNSGGPLIDKNYNLQGVVKARKTYYFKTKQSTYSKVTGIAVALNPVKNLLHKNNVNIEYGNNSPPSKELNNHSKKFMVNIHCVK